MVAKENQYLTEEKYSLSATIQKRLRSTEEEEEAE